MPARSPKQWTIKIQKETCAKDNLFAAINLEALERAAQNLKAGAFKLWVYFAKNQNGYEFGLSNVEVYNSFGIKKDQYDSARQELVDSGYLERIGESNYYIFHEIPLW